MLPHDIYLVAASLLTLAAAFSIISAALELKWPIMGIIWALGAVYCFYVVLPMVEYRLGFVDIFDSGLRIIASFR